MPLSEQGIIQVSARMRQEESAFAEKYGEEKLQEKLDREGVYAYGFYEKGSLRVALDELCELSNECKWGNDPELTKYSRRLQDRYTFGYSLYSSIVGPDAEYLLLEKPIPKRSYEELLIAKKIDYWEVGVFRLGELTEAEIKNRTGGGVLWHSYCYVDLSGNINKHIVNEITWY